MVGRRRVGTMELAIRASDKARDFLEEIVTEMLILFPITRDEAVGRINEAWRHLGYVGDDDLIFHETKRYWAMTIYYGKESKWWLGTEGLRPRPYPSAGG
jgi:hypothetical protein